MKFTCSTTAGNPSRQNCQQLFQQNWKKIGVEMEIKNMPASVVWGEYTIKSQFDTLLVAWEPTVGMDPDYTARCHSKFIPAKAGSGSNYVQYENPELDALLDLGVTQTVTAERKATYAKIQEILLRDVPFAPQGAVQQGFVRHTGAHRHQDEPVRRRQHLERAGLGLELAGLSRMAVLAIRHQRIRARATAEKAGNVTGPLATLPATGCEA